MSSVEESTWSSAFRAARTGSGTADILWLGDSISELNAKEVPLPWQVGELLSARSESVQYRSVSTDPYARSLRVEGSALPDDEAGLGGRSAVLGPGQSAAFEASGEAMTVLWTRRPGGGTFEVVWGGEVLGTISTDGQRAYSRLTFLRRSAGTGTEAITLTARAGDVVVEGIYLHNANSTSGVRVWPAVRSGNRSSDFVANPGWALGAVDSIRPDLVVIATGTNDDSYPEEVEQLVRSVRGVMADVTVALWLPPLTTRFTRARAAAGREVADRLGLDLIDTAAALGRLPTIDGVHPSAVTSALAAGHVASVLGGDELEPAGTLVAQVVAGLAGGQVWEPGQGSVSVESVLGMSVLSGRDHKADVEIAWGFASPSMAEMYLDMPGASLFLGPGGDDRVDTFLSRSDRARLSVNGGSGQVDLARLCVTPSTGASTPTSGALLWVRDGAAGAELMVSFPDGTAVVLAGTTSTDAVRADRSGRLRWWRPKRRRLGNQD